MADDDEIEEQTQPAPQPGDDKKPTIPDIRNSDEELLRRIIAHLRVRTGHDFSRYKRSTVLRRIARRMRATRADDLKEYYEAMRESADEAQALLGDLLISVTTFFRDGDAFAKIAKDVIPALFRGKEADETISIWVSGCATGEEAYSFAILLLEETARHPIRVPIQVFGSDLDARALAAAREGRFPVAIETDVSEERLRRFFLREGDHYRVRQEVRDLVLFAVHDLLEDPPFSHVELISCRNVLIYLDRDLQEQLTSTFHYALNPGGYLFLGASESADNPPGLFRTVDRTARIYQSTAMAGDEPRLLPRLLGPVRAREQMVQRGRAGSPTVALGEAAMHRRALEQVAPPSMLVDESLVARDRQTSDETVRRLTQELELTQTRLRTVREESDAANEELRAANEELQSVSAEYRSTSKELETSKEELQSINEELQTVNSELKLKLETISRANSDLQNLIAATDIGTLFLDSALRIKRFTDRVTDLFGITSTDEGRSIADFAHQLEYQDLVKDARAVLTNLAPIRNEIRSRAGRWYDMRVRPYRTVDDKIDGVVITFVDITERSQFERRQQLLLGELAHRVRNTLAVVQAIAHQSMRTSKSSEEFVQRFDGRLAALASSHTLLVNSDWEGADLATLARTQLEPYTSENPNRVRISGEPVRLPADLATPFGLILHELATNAAKHGSLSRPKGGITVEWTVTRNDPHVLKVVWREQGGAPVQQPVTSGFGSALIENGISSATVKREFKRSGLICTIELPLSKPAEHGGSDVC